MEENARIIQEKNRTFRGAGPAEIFLTLVERTDELWRVEGEGDMIGDRPIRVTVVPRTRPEAPMSDSPSLRLHCCLDRLKEGDSSARDELLDLASGRLRSLAHRMLLDDRRVRRWEETADVLQGALIRLCRALDAAPPTTPQEFYRLAALQMRRELIDLARHHYGPQGAGAHHATAQLEKGRVDTQAHEPADVTLEASRGAAWTEFHEQVARLPDEHREVFDLLFYQGLSQADAAEVLGVHERTIKRRWQAARLRLHEAMGGEMPGF